MPKRFCSTKPKDRPSMFTSGRRENGYWCYVCWPGNARCQKCVVQQQKDLAEI